MKKYKTMEQLKTVLDFFEKETNLKINVKIKNKDKVIDTIELTPSTFILLFGSAKIYNPYIDMDNDENFCIEISIDI